MYDLIGNIIKNRADGYNITWTASRKVKTITKFDDKAGDDLEFMYDAFGRRIVKIVKPRALNPQTGKYYVLPQEQWDYQVYGLDASGNILATYSHKILGESNCGKGVLVNAFRCAFEDYICEYDANNLLYNPSNTQDESKKLSWLSNLNGSRLSFSNECRLDYVITRLWKYIY